eukprot:CAMPEP_0119075998 /NCGR_PEP_ID=MMETSP1178-20130426/83522_1 /TAXON_ID=33656 /ORGANISM="unid sp, Strain CCMP2000" /LENGTH=152 /DNA_ID=CAMNT_0007058257 /DNA_START=95 /DNA_END=553 /DNA_ORIENTATION=-
MSLTIETELGVIKLKMRADAAPTTAAYIRNLAQDGIYDGCTFYRSDFVIQCGLHGTGKTTGQHGDLKVNETSVGPKVSNTRGTAAVAHWDVPDCGNSEFFINLGNNSHLDEAYGGYCVFAQVEDDASFGVVDAIAAAVKSKGKVAVMKITCP